LHESFVSATGKLNEILSLFFTESVFVCIPPSHQPSSLICGAGEKVDDTKLKRREQEGKKKAYKVGSVEREFLCSVVKSSYGELKIRASFGKRTTSNFIELLKLFLSRLPLFLNELCRFLDWMRVAEAERKGKFVMGRICFSYSFRNKSLLESFRAREKDFPSLMNRQRMGEWLGVLMYLLF
jgi:hypothetical protein